VSRISKGHVADAQASLHTGAREVGFHVLSMSLSLIACFIHPAHGRHRRPLFPRVRVTLSVAILISLVLSLTTTPMMCCAPAAARGRASAGWSTGASAVRRDAHGYQRASAGRCATAADDADPARDDRASTSIST
jgi:multidrug efflux pump subunit AcrB